MLCSAVRAMVRNYEGMLHKLLLVLCTVHCHYCHSPLRRREPVW